MLVKIYPEQFRKGWDTFAPLIQDALPGDLAVREGALTNVLRAVIMERATPWVDVGEEEGSRAFILTTERQDPITFSKSLMIYVLTVFGEPGDREEWRSAIETLKGHARSKGCEDIVSYIYDERYKRYLSSLGADVSASVARFEV